MGFPRHYFISEGKFVIMLGRFHTEIAALKLLGDLLDGTHPDILWVPDWTTLTQA